MNSTKVQPVLPMRIKATPYEHQVKAFNYALKIFNVEPETHRRISKGCAYLMDMGTGKTITTIAVLGALLEKQKVKRVLIVAPKTIVPVWEEEFEKWADFNYNLVVLDGSTQKKADTIRHMQGVALQVIVVNYESCWRLEDELKKWNPDAIICDESSKIKNARAKASMALHRLGKISEYNMILTGTPVVNNPLDFFSQYKFLDEKIFGGSYYAFRSKYAILGGFKNHQVVAYKNLDEMTSKAHGVAYRVKLEDAVDLLDIIEETREVALEKNAKDLYKEIEKNSCAELFSGEITARNVLTKLLRLSQVTSGFLRNDDCDDVRQISSAKMEAPEELVGSFMEEGKKVVIIARFIPQIKAIEKMIKSKGIGYSMICGEEQDRQVEVDKF